MARRLGRQLGKSSAVDSNPVTAGTPLDLAIAVIGHSREVARDHYLRVNTDAQRETMGKLAEVYGLVPWEPDPETSRSGHASLIEMQTGGRKCSTALAGYHVAGARDLVPEFRHKILAHAIFDLCGKLQRQRDPKEWRRGREEEPRSTQTKQNQSATARNDRLNVP